MKYGDLKRNELLELIRLRLEGMEERNRQRFQLRKAVRLRHKAKIARLRKEPL